MIIVISGPPAAGKTTVALELAKLYEKSVVFHVDDIRHAVVQGKADSFPIWNEETEHQFELAERVAADAAKTYHSAGFVAILDHCRRVANLENWVSRDFKDQRVIKVAILPSLETNLDRNASRTGKPFDFDVLVPIIESVSEDYVQSELADWLCHQNEFSPTQTAHEIYSLIEL